MKANSCSALLLFGVKQIKRCGLTRRSTGPIAAGRHLGYKSISQIPAHRNRPVSLYVRPHSSQTVDHHLRRVQNSRKDLFRQCCSVPRDCTAKASHAVFERMVYLEMRITVKISLSIIYSSLPSNYEISFCGNFEKVIRVLVGASRRRAAPRSQSSGAAHVAQCHLIG